jgi:hypothetical protein
MLKAAGPERIQDPLVALEEEIKKVNAVIKEVEDELKKVKERIDRFEVKHSKEELSEHALYIALVSYRNVLVARLIGLESRREMLETEAGKNPAVAAAANERKCRRLSFSFSLRFIPTRLFPLQLKLCSCSVTGKCSPRSVTCNRSTHAQFVCPTRFWS